MEEDKAVLEEIKVRLKLHQESMDEEDMIIDDSDASLKRLSNYLSYWEAGSFPHNPETEEDGKKSSWVNNWQESCNLPREWMSKKEQQTLKGNKGSSHVENTSQDNGWQETSDLPRGWMSNDKQLNFKEDMRTW